MERHLLVTVSEQQRVMHAVRFVGHFFSSKTDMKITLFYTAPTPPAVWEGERTAESLSRAEHQAASYRKKGEKALEAAKKELCQLGLRSDQVNTKLQIRKYSKVLDIIQEGGKGLYDALVLGRRGLSWLEQSFDESVSKSIFDKQVQFPIWICRNPDLDRRNVLLCVDGSEAAYRMVDHVGFMLGQESEQEVSLFTVLRKGVPPAGGEDTTSKSLEMLESAGFPRDRVRVRDVQAVSVSKAILKEAEEGRFSVVALGRTGTGRGFLKKVFMGSVSETLFHQLEGAALWTCH